MKNKIQGIFGFLRLTRFWNLGIILLTQIFTAHFLITSRSDVYSIDQGLIFTILSTLLIASGGYLINDYYDVKIDYVNKPERVVVGKVFKRRVVIVMHLLLSSLGLLMGFLVGLKIFLINALSIGLLWLYSNQLKRLPLIGNIIVAFLTALSVLIIGIYYNHLEYNIFLYALFAFVYTLLREVVKDIEDMKGDSEFGCKTLPIAIGIRKTKIVLYVILLLFTTGAYFMVDISDDFWRLFISFLTILNLYYILRLSRADTVGNFRFLSWYSKIVMLMGILSMVFVV